MAEAFASFDRAIELAPDLGVAHHNRASALAALERCEEALRSFDRARALDLNPADRISALGNRGKTLVKLRRLEEALASYDQALALAPDHVDTLVRRGTVLTRLGRSDEALAVFAAALRINPDCLDAYVNRGNAYAVLNQFDAALADFALVTARQPDHADANFNEALVRLCLGDFARGWRKYEYRWQCSQFAALRPNLARPMWHGDSDPRGKTILLYAEQGMGDVIQFVRYAPLLAARGAKVIVGVHRPLAAILTGVPGVAGVIAEGEALPPFDLYCPMMSLPLAFGTELATIPATVPYIRAQQARIDRWRERLPQSGRLRVGICWAGTAAHPNDRRRSIPLATFAKILAVEGVDFFSLQKEVTEADAVTLNAHGVAQLGQGFADFADTAAVIAQLDLVIAVDTSVVHLAGAMAKATAALIAFAPDFRWMLDRTDTPGIRPCGFTGKTRSTIGRHRSNGCARNWRAPCKAVSQRLYAKVSAHKSPSASGECQASANGAAESGKRRNAVVAGQQAAGSNAGHADVHLKRGIALRAQGKIVDAIAALRQAVELRPDLALSHFYLGSVLHECRLFDDAVGAYREAIRINPNYVEAYTNLGAALHDQGKAEEAVAAERQALRLKPTLVPAYVNLGAALNDVGKSNEAASAYCHAIALQPDCDVAYGNLGSILMELGRLTESRTALERAVQLAPRSIKYRRYLGELDPYVAGDARLAALEELSQNAAQLSVDERVELYFALGKAYADTRQHAKAFDSWRDGNALRRQQVKYDEPAELAALARIRSAFTPDLFRARQNVGHPSAVPIFIVGMPRSGTTLIEQILASHPQVFGAGELTCFDAAIGDVRARLEVPCLFRKSCEA